MEKEKYEKPSFEMIILLNESFLTESPDPEETEGGFDDEETPSNGDALTMLTQMNDMFDGFLGEDSDESQEPEGDGPNGENPVEIPEEDHSIVDEIIEAINDVTDEINDTFEGGENGANNDFNIDTEPQNDVNDIGSQEGGF